MKTKKRQILLWAIPVLILAGFLLTKPGYYLYRELEYRMGSPTEAEQKVYAYAEKMGISFGRYPKEILALLENNPETEAFVLGYPNRQEMTLDLSAYSRDTVPLFLQWDPMWGYADYGASCIAVTGCGPTCLAMAGYYLTGEETMNPETVAAFAEKNGYYAPGYGSSWTLISEGARQLDLNATELPLVKKKITNALEAGHPVILAMGEGDFTTTGHYIVLTGYEDGAFTLNDPNSRLRSQQTWTYEQLEGQIRNIWEISRQ